MKKELGCFVVGDSTKCTGCRACELACFTVHNRESNHVGKPWELCRFLLRPDYF